MSPKSTSATKTAKTTNSPAILAGALKKQNRQERRDVQPLPDQ
jgi:hypothetical protein